MENLERRMLLAGVGLVGAAAALSRSAAAGQLNPPPGPVTPTQATPVQSLPGDATAQYIISAPGAYVLTGNIQSVAGKDGIRIAASGVTLDLAGFKLSDTHFTNAAVIGASAKSVTLRNGHLDGWLTAIRNPDGEVWTISDLTIFGSGTAIALVATASVRNVFASTCGNGIVLDAASETAVEQCRVVWTGGGSTPCTGIVAMRVSNSVVANIGGGGTGTATGINCGAANDCTVESVSSPLTALGILALGLVNGCTVRIISSAGGTALGISSGSAVACHVESVQQNLPSTGQCIGIRGGEVTSCEVSNTGGQTTAKVAGISNVTGAVSNCYVTSVFNATPGGTTYGIDLGAQSSGNACTITMNASGIGIGIFGIDTRITDNRVQGGATGVQATGKSFVAGNYVAAATTSYSADASSMLGPVATATGIIATTNPWANFST